MDDSPDRMDWKPNTPLESQPPPIIINKRLARTRKFDEYAEGERVEMDRVQEAFGFATSPTPYVIPPDSTPPHINTNTDSTPEHTNLHVRKFSSWSSLILQSVLVSTMIITLISKTILTSAYQKATRTGYYFYKNRRRIRQNCAEAVQSSCNTAKRRIVSLTYQVADAHHVITPPLLMRYHPRRSPRIANNRVHRQQTTNNQAQSPTQNAEHLPMDVAGQSNMSEDSPSAMQGIESGTQDTDEYMMSGGIPSPYEDGFENPHFDPIHIDLVSDLEDLEAGIVDITSLSAFNLSPTIDHDHDSTMDVGPEDLDSSMVDIARPSPSNPSSAVNHDKVESHDSTMDVTLEDPNASMVDITQPSTPNLSSAINRDEVGSDGYMVDMPGNFPTDDTSQEQHQAPIASKPRSFVSAFMDDMDDMDDIDSPQMEKQVENLMAAVYEFEDDLDILTCVQLQQAHDEDMESFENSAHFSEQSEIQVSKVLRQDPVEPSKPPAISTTKPPAVSTAKSPTRSKTRQLSPVSTGISKVSTKKTPGKNVAFFESPKTGRPVTKIKKFISGESMDFPASSSPCDESILSSAGSSSLPKDSPTMIEQTEASSSELNNPGFGTAHCLYQPIKDPASRRLKEVESVGSSSRNPEPAGRSENVIRVHKEAILADIVNSRSVGRVTRQRSQAQSVTISSRGSPVKAKPTNLNPNGARHTSSGKSNVVSQGPVRSWTPEGSPLAAAKAIFDHPKGNASESHTQLPQSKQIESSRKEDGLAEGEILQPLQDDSSPSNLENIASLTNENKMHSTDEGIAQMIVDEAGSQTVKGDVSELVFESTETVVTMLDVPTSESKQITSSTASPEIVEVFTELRVSGRRRSGRKLAKGQKEEKTRAEKAAVKAAEKARKAEEEAAEKARKEKEQEGERRRKGARRIPRQKIIQPLTDEWESRVKAALDTVDMQQVLVTLPSGTNLTRKDLGTVKVVRGRDPAHGWLNDEIILASLQQVVEYGLRISGHQADQTPTHHVFNTFFYKNLRDKGAQSIKRWATKAKIGGKALEQVERVFIPVHQGAHWTLLVVSPMARTIEYFDSMGGRADSYIRNAKFWLEQEMGKAWKEEEWSVPTGTLGAGPRQTNGSDCGVFTCTTARMVVLGVDPMAYGGEDMGTQRGRMVAELLNGGLGGDFEPSVVF